MSLDRKAASAEDVLPTVQLKGECEIETGDVTPGHKQSSEAVLFRNKRTLIGCKCDLLYTTIHKNTILYNSFTSAGPNCILPFR